MHRIVEEKRAELVELCEKYRVRRLDIFGSAADGSFDEQKSDLDFLVDYLPLAPGEHYEAYFGLMEALRELFDRPIDLVEAGAMKNPYFIRRVNESRRELYAA